MSKTLNGRFRQAAALLLSSVLLWCSVPASAQAAESIDPATDAMVQSYEAKLADLQRRQSVATEELIACGDSGNDIPMLLYAGLGIAVENALPETKAAP